MFNSASPTTPYHRSLGNGLTLKSISTEDEIERVAAFNDHIHGEDLDAMTRGLVLHHPHTRPEHWLFVEDDASRDVVSALCLIPWTWRCDGVELKAGEMGIVGTREDFRHRGLIRALDARFKELLNEGEYDLSQIQGIPYYYRLFGYEYALPLEGGWHLAPHQVPEGVSDVPRYSFRQATIDDLPTLQAFYADMTGEIPIHAVRSPEVWRYLLEHPLLTANKVEFWLVTNATGKVEGYTRVDQQGFGTGLIVAEGYCPTHAAAVAMLQHLKALALERDKPYIRLMDHDQNVLVQAARYYGARDDGRYAWQIMLPAPERLLHKLQPAFERRLAASPFQGLTRTVRLNLYRTAYDLRFEGGCLQTVDAVGFQEQDAAISLPPTQLVPLALGYRTHAELREAYPDVRCYGQDAYLVDVLFPKLDAHIHLMY
ncbi:MAG: GNAT family N-acetyltransferase [Chloroflexi bacterium]|nr:GNAT family N-acetyltransferase [Chloroflexota bacterium]